MTLPFGASLFKLQGYEFSRPLNAMVAFLQSSAKTGRAITPADSQRAIAVAKASLRLTQSQHCSGLYVGTNRTELTKRMLASQADWLLQIDTDVEFPEDLIDRMLDLAGDDKKILAASVPLGTGIPTTGYYATGKPGVFESIQSIPRQPIEVDGIATACAMVHREVFETIAEKHGQCWWNHLSFPKNVPTNGNDVVPQFFEFIEIGEDLSFSIRAQSMGFKLWCVHIGGLGHWKSHKLSHDNELAAALAADDMGVGEIVED